MVNVIDRDALKRRKWNVAKIREKAKAEKQRRMTEIFGEGHTEKKTVALAKLIKS